MLTDVSHVSLTDVSHVPSLLYHPFSLPFLNKNGRDFNGHLTGVVVKLRSECLMILTLSGTLFSLYGYRVVSTSTGKACAGEPSHRSATVAMVCSSKPQKSKRSFSRANCRSARDASVAKRFVARASSSPPAHEEHNMQKSEAVL